MSGSVSLVGNMPTAIVRAPPKLTMLTWVGGGPNAASDPDDWSPTVAPAAGDTLMMSMGTINITDDDLAGNPLTFVTPTSGTPVFQNTVNLANGSARLTDANGNDFTLTTSDSVASFFAGGAGVGFNGSMSLSPNGTTTLTGAVKFLYGVEINPNGNNGSNFVNDGAIGLTNASINANVSGTGTFDLTRYHDGPGRVEINGSVAAGLTFTMDGSAGEFPSVMTLDQPTSFDAQVNVPATDPSGMAGADTINLEGLTATSYTLANGVFTLYNGLKTVDTLNLTTKLPLTVDQDASSVGLYFNETDNSSGSTPIPMRAPTPLTINAPTAVTIPLNVASAISGVSLAENAVTPTETFSVSLQDTNGDLSVSPVGPGVTISGNGTPVLELAGPFDQVNAALAGLTDTDSVSASDTIGINATDSFNVGAETSSIAVTVKGLPNPPFPPPATPPNFDITDVTTGQSGTAAGESYSGPVQGLSKDIILLTEDNINVDPTMPNVFIHTGSGNDAIDVSGVNGNNVLDASTGTNFFTGGTGDDTFYVDARNATADIFDTINGFHSGDFATIWGIPAGDQPTTGNNVVSGASGLDFAWVLGGHDVNLNIPGYSTDDLSNGRLSVSFGTSPDTPGLPGSPYMLIQANS